MTRTKLGIAIFLALSVPAAAFAGGNDKGDAHDSMFKTMDSNGDGKISADEHTAGAKAMFEKMDANKDGKVTAEEMTAAHEKIAGKKAKAGEMSAAEKIKTFDTNGDGVLTAEEHAAGAKAMFEKMDTDKDNFLTPAEMSAGHATMMKKEK